MFVCSHTQCVFLFCSLLLCLPDSVCSLFFVSSAAPWRIKINNNNVNAKYCVPNTRPATVTEEIQLLFDLSIYPVS